MGEEGLKVLTENVFVFYSALLVILRCSTFVTCTYISKMAKSCLCKHSNEVKKKKSKRHTEIRTHIHILSLTSVHMTNKDQHHIFKCYLGVLFVKLSDD